MGSSTARRRGGALAALLASVCLVGVYLIWAMGAGTSAASLPAVTTGMTPAGDLSADLDSGGDATLVRPGAATGSRFDDGAVAASEGPPPSPPPGPTEDEEPLGYIVGYLSDADGEPATRELRFERLWGTSSMEVTRTDDAGFYSMPLAPGSYRVFVDWASDMGVTLGDPAFSAAGDVEVFDGKETLLDITAEGTRTVRGGFTSAEHDEVLLEVELVLPEDPTLVVAKALAIRNDGQHQQFVKAEAERTAESAAGASERRYPPGMGYFEIGGLPAGLYEIRAYLDVEKKFYVRGIVDLREGDFDFKPRSVETESFFQHAVLELNEDS